MLKIWGRASSSNVQKVLWCCAELDLPFERLDVGGTFGGNRDAEYLALNPNGLVPTVKDGDLIMWESNTICRYLAATRNGERLYPRDPAARTGRLDDRRRRDQGSALSRRRRAEPRRDRARHPDLPLVRLSDRAAIARQSARLV